MNSQICALAYDPVQSLLAVGTKESRFGPGQIYVFGQSRVQATFSLPSRASANTLHFVTDKLICLDSKHDLTLYSLDLKRIVASHSPPGIATALATDPMLDYALTGMQTGDIFAYDIDRKNVAPLRIPNLWSGFDSRARISPVVSLQFHPRDIGTLLIGYTHGACLYSFKQNKAMKFFRYELQPGAPGGQPDPALINTLRRPQLTHAVWHPTGSFILTAHEDSSLVFWDPTIGKDSRIIMARTLADTNIDKPGTGATTLGGPTSTMTLKEPIFRISWCANKDPDDTAILISGGVPSDMPTKGLTLFELGRTPVYATSTWEVMANHFESPKRQRILPTPPGAGVVNFCLIPRTSPHFAAAQDPIAIVSILTSGELITLSFPSGLPITPTNQLHVSLTLAHPFVRHANLLPMDRTRWLGMTERRSHGPAILTGGAEGTYPMRRYENRNIIQTAHADGTVRLWDVGHGDEIENPKVIQVDVARAVGRFDNVEITSTSLSGASGEFVAGLRSGEAAIFRWGHNRHAGKEPPSNAQNKPGTLTNVVDRIDPTLSEGLLPFTLLNANNGPITAVKISDVGFVAVASEGGNLAVIDLRGPAIIFNENITSLGSSSKGKSSVLRRSTSGPIKPDWVSTMVFSVMRLESEDYSSILLHAGTNNGQVATLKIIPDPSGRYAVEFIGAVNLDGRLIHLAPINAATGLPASASQTAVGGLRNGLKIDGALIAVTQSEVRIFRPATSKGAHKTFDNVFCDAAGVSRYQDQGHAVVCLFGDGTTRAYSIPALKEIGSANVSNILDVRRFKDAVITSSGNILGWTGPSEMALLTVWGTGQPLERSHDKLYNPDAIMPPRPTISNLQWVTGVQYVSPADMDILSKHLLPLSSTTVSLTISVGGPDRPPSKRALAQTRMEEQQRLAAKGRTGTGSTSSSGPPPGSDETWASWTQRQMNERMAAVSNMGEGMSNLQDNSAGWADDVSKYVNKQKRGLIMGAIKGKFF